MEKSIQMILGFQLPLTQSSKLRGKEEAEVVAIGGRQRRRQSDRPWLQRRLAANRGDKQREARGREGSLNPMAVFP